MPEALSVKTFQRRDTIPARPDTLWWLKQGAVKVVNLLWLSQRFGHNTERGRYIDLRLTHQDIADIVGATRVTITRLLNQFERQGMISRLDGYILILPPALAKFNAYS